MSKSKLQMQNQVQKPKPKYDFEERTALFGEKVILFCKKSSKNTLIAPLLLQLIRSSTSIGANYCEADGAESKKDFNHKIGICKKEAKETKQYSGFMERSAGINSDFFCYPELVICH